MVESTAADFARRLADDLRRPPAVLVTLAENQVAVVAQLLSLLGLYTTAEAAPLDQLAKELGQGLARQASDARAAAGEPASSPSGDVMSPDEIAVAIVKRRNAGEHAADIGHDFNITPLEVLDLVRDVRNGDRILPIIAPPAVSAAASTDGAVT